MPSLHRRTRTTILLALATALALLAAGCTMQTKPPTDVTASAATLNAQVGCSPAPYGPVWWELREVGSSTWRLVGAEQSVSCPRAVSGDAPQTTGISERIDGLRSGVAYEYRVGMHPPSGEGAPVYSDSTRFTAGTSRRPVVVGSTLTAGGARLQLRGVNVWGLQDSITGGFGASQYANRAQVVRTIKSWGANLVRFRVLADDYNSSPKAATGNLTKAQFIQRIKDWRDAVVGAGMYFMPCSWDALDGAYSDARWAGNGGRVHQLFADIHRALGDDPMVIYEVTNEPNNVSWDQWNANMQASVKYFRETIGYRGLLVIDPIWWANSGTGGQGYDDARYTSLENYDAAQRGMGSHQLAFAKHDYANSYAGKAWNAGAWAGAQGGGQTKHLIFETEFGNYNGDPSTVSATWAAAAADFFGKRFAAQPNYVGAAAFVFGPWYDANGLTGGDNLTPTAWGNSVKGKLF